MTDAEMILQAIEGFKDEVQEQFKKVDIRLDKMDKRLDSIEERLEALEEDSQITRTAANVTLDVVKEMSEELTGRGLYNPSDKTKKAI